MVEIEIKNNETGKRVFVSDLPTIDRFATETITAFVHSYENQIFEMFSHKRTKNKSGKVISKS